jgi:hypothetical protein
MKSGASESIEGPVSRGFALETGCAAHPTPAGASSVTTSSAAREGLNRPIAR